MSDVPPNIQEFNQIAALIFAQLYKTFPAVEDIDREGIAKAIGVVGTDWSQHQLPSGRTLGQMVAYTIGWLNSEDYIRAFGSHPAMSVLLTTRGLTAMNAVPSGLKESLGTELTKAVEQGSSSKIDVNRIGDLIGGVFGGIIKSVSS